MSLYTDYEMTSVPVLRMIPRWPDVQLPTVTRPLHFETSSSHCSCGQCMQQKISVFSWVDRLAYKTRILQYDIHRRQWSIAELNDRRCSTAAVAVFGPQYVMSLLPAATPTAGGGGGVAVRRRGPPPFIAQVGGLSSSCGRVRLSRVYPAPPDLVETDDSLTGMTSRRI